MDALQNAITAKVSGKDIKINRTVGGNAQSVVNQINYSIDIDPQEYAILRKEVFRKYASVRGKAKKYDSAFTANYYYIYKNVGYGDFKTLLQLSIEHDRDLIESVERRIQDGAHTTSREIFRYISLFESEQRYSDWDSINAQKGRPNEGNGSIYKSESRSGRGGASEESAGNLRDKGRGLKYSLSDTDSQGRKLTKEQKEFFKDSKVRDEQGRLLKVYHGTVNEFTVFDRTKARSYSAVDYN